MYLYHVFAVCQLYRDGGFKRIKKIKNLLQVPLSSPLPLLPSSS